MARDPLRGFWGQVGGTTPVEKGLAVRWPELWSSTSLARRRWKTHGNAQPYLDNAFVPQDQPGHK
jgi:hypothetical protein